MSTCDTQTGKHANWACSVDGMVVALELAPVLVLASDMYEARWLAGNAT